MVPSIAFILWSLLFELVTSQPRVCIPDVGCVRGVEVNGFQGAEKYEAFFGIPYAMKPIEELRFANPKPARPWFDDLNATFPKPQCIQKNYLLPNPVVSGKEDCLYLNIYRPKNRGPWPMSVMVYIHGGGFFSGTINPNVLGPEYFMYSKQVILVTVAYRLGPFGFLSTCDENIRGNFGLKDQNIALQWVKQHISQFDGHPDHVTIFGHGTGAASVHMHMLSRKSRGLFRYAILMSGNAAAPFANLTPDPLRQTRELLRLLGFNFVNSMTTKELAENLRDVAPERILDAADGFKEWDVDPLIVFRPVIEFPSEEAFLTSDPKFTIASGQYKKVPWMMGLVPNEGSVRSLTILANATLRDQFNRRFVQRFMSLMELPPSERTFETEQLLLKYYFDKINQLNDNTYQSFMDSITERAFVHPFIKTLQQYLTNSNIFSAPVYLYRFNYRGQKSYSNLHTGKLLDYGVVHSDDLIYLFRSPALFPTDFRSTSTEANVMREMVDIYTTFANTGKPKRSKDIRPCDRKAMSQKDKICDYWEIANRGTSFDVKIRNDLDKNPVKLWDKVVELFDWCYY